MEILGIGTALSTPTVTTPTATSITNTSAVLGANVTSDGGTAITARGTVYGTDTNPTGNAMTHAGTTGVFSHTRTGLTPNTFYYYRGYATNSQGTAYSANGTFTSLHNAPNIGTCSGQTTSSLQANWTAPSGTVGSEAFTYEVQLSTSSTFASVLSTQSGISSVTTSHTFTGLNPSTPYYYRVRANNAGGSSAWSAISAGCTTTAAATPTLSTTALAAFGSQCVGGTYGPNTFTINGSSLTNADVTVAALSGFEYATSSGGSYNSSLTLSQLGGTFSQVIYVRFIPTAATNYSGNIVVGGGGATNVNVDASGTGLVNHTPTVSIAITSGVNPTCSGNPVTFTATPANTGGGTVNYQWRNNAVNIPGQTSPTYSTTSLTNGSSITCEITVTGVCVTSSTALSNAIAMTVNTIPASPVANGNVSPQITNVNPTDFTANWNSVSGATGYALDVFYSGTQTIFEEDFTGFEGAGFGPAPSVNQLSSNNWKVTGMSDGNGIFGGTHTSGDFARGASNGSVTTGGVYGFNVGAGNRALGFQPGGSDFTPGTVVLRIQNTTGSTITSLDVSYVIWVYNDQGRANSFNFAHSANDVSYTSVPALNYTSPQAASGSPSWESVGRSTTLTGLNIANNAYYYLQWNSDDVSGSGSRDELALDDVLVTTTGNQFVTGYENLSVAGTTQVVSGLTAGETYTYRVRATNSCGTSGNSNEVEVNTSCSTPTTHASNVSASSVTGTTATVSWTNGNGPGRIVVLREGSAVNANPADDATYTGNIVFGSGSQIGTGNFVVYSGSGSTVNITGLTPGTYYFAEVFEYDCSAGAEWYLTTGTPGNIDFVTIPNTPTALTSTCVSENSINLTWTAPSGNVDGYLLVARPNATEPSVAGLNPTTQGHNLNFASAPVFSTSSRVMHIGTGNSVTVTGLTAGTTYTYRVYTYSLGSSSTYRHSTGTSITRLSSLENVILPAAAGTNLAALVSWTNPGAACFDEVMVVANLTPGIQFSPTGDGSAYIPNQTYVGPNSIVYKADANTNAADVLGLTNNTTYYFEIFVRKGTQWSTGVEVSAIPNNATVFGPGDIAIIAINTQYLSSGSDDEVCFFAFKDIEQGTSIDFTDNGYERVSAGLWGDTEGTIRITRTGGGTISAGRVVCLRGQGNSSSDFSIRNCGSADNANWNISSLNGALYSFDLNQNDQIWMFQNGAWSNPPGSHNATYTGNVVWGWTAIGWEPSPGYASTAGSTLYEGTECFNVNLQGIPNNDKVKYTGPMTATSQIVWIQRINTPANWTGYSSNSNYNSGGQNYGGSCVTFPFTTVGLTPGVWNGFKNTDWFDCNNWDDLRVPQASVDVTIPNVTNKPVIGSGTGQCRDIQIQASSNLTMNHSASVLEVYGSWFNNSGSILSLQGNNSATVKMRGGGTRSVGGSTETYFQRLIVENGTHVNLERDTRVGGTGLLRVTGAGSRLGALHSVGSQRDLNIQGNTTMELTAGGTMDDNALDHLTILTGGNSSSATFSGSGQAIKCWNFEPVKTTSGGVTLSANTPFICKNDFDANLNGTAVFTDNGSTITVGDDIVLAGGGPSNYNFTGTFVLNGAGSGATSTIQDGTDAPKGHLNNLTINPPVGRPDVQFNPQTGSQTTVVKGNLTILSGQTSVYGNTIEVRGNWDNQVGETAFIEGTSTIVFNGSGTQTLSCPGGEYFHDLSRSGSGTLQLATGIHVTRDFGMTSGTLDVMPANHPINVQRNWTHTAGTFTPRTGTVTFYGALNTLINGINMHRLDMQKDATARTVTTASNLLLTGRLNLQVGRFVMPTHTVTAHDAVIDSPAALLDIEGPSVLNITMP